MKSAPKLMVFCSVALLPWLSATAKAQTIVSFPDPNLESAVRSALGEPTDPLTSSDLEFLVSLNACSQSITNLSGLEWAKNLTDLNLSGNLISDLMPVQDLNRLIRLIMDNNRVSDLSPLAGLTNMTFLSLGHNLILDGGGISGLTNLSRLYLQENSITNLTFLQSLPQLESLQVDNNRIVELSPLVVLTNLNSISLGGNPVADYSTLSALTNLNVLSVREGSITNLAVLKDLSRLTSLSLYRNAVKDVTPLVGLTNLSSLDLRWNPLTSPDLTLAGFTNLTTLYLGGSSISDASFLGNLYRLKFLNLGDNKVRDLAPLATLTNLNYLVLSGNPITNEMVLSGLTNLVNLELRGSSISNLTFVSSLKQLAYADLAHNNIVDISPLALLANLETLVLSGNPIGSHAGLSATTNLVNLWLADNSISDLIFLQGLSQLRFLILDDNHVADPSPLATLTNLVALGLSRNSLTNQAVLGGFTNLGSIWLDGNAISNLSFLSGLTGLKTLELQNNQINDLTDLFGLTNLVTVLADYNRLTNITTLDHLPRLARVQLVGNPLEVVSGSNAVTIQRLWDRGVDVAYLPTNQPPTFWLSTTNWFIAANETASLDFYLSDDITPYDELLVSSESSTPDLISSAIISVPGTNSNRTLTVMPAANQTGTTTLTIAACDAAGVSNVVFVRVSVLVPQPVSIPDPSLANAIRSTLSKPAGRLSTVDLLGLTDLFVAETNVADLSGLEWATNLASLSLSGNSLTNLAALQNLGSLRFLALYNNNLIPHPSLAGLTNLVGLYLIGNAIGDVSFLQELQQLTFLNLDNNQIVDLAPLSTLTNINSISLRQNRLANLVPLQNMPALTEVDVSLNLLDLSSNSPAMAVIQAWEQQGVVVNYLPQRGAPVIEVRSTWLIPWNGPATLSFRVTDNGIYASQFGVAAASSNASIIPNESVAVGESATGDWFLSVTPVTNKIGDAQITLTATNDVGLAESATIFVTVVTPLPLEDSLLEGTNLMWLTGGDAPWFGQARVAHEGGSAAQSGSIQDDHESWMETTLDGPGILTYWWKVSSEESWDWLEFSLNGSPLTYRISGEVDWELRTVSIPRGQQVARWRFVKDDAYSRGLDAAWVDHVTFLPLSWLELVGFPNNGQCELLLHPVLGRHYLVQASTNLSAWVTLAVVTATNTAMPFVDSTATTSVRFYRLQELTANSIQLRDPTWVAGEFQLELQSPPGLRFELQASEDLLNWGALGVVSNAFGAVQYTDLPATNSLRRYYRALLLP